ncbi:MAG TPA: ubiquitin-like domain-containing protein [Cerasibacillus sp.]|uniref:ubiquitin-like domain-containing protein n=1 Tax=Cerasibacillus sp. TaxID=2498711 RepID=UPI002F3E4BFD
MRNFSKLFPSAKLRPLVSTIGVIALTLFSVVVLYETSKVEVVFADNGKNQTIKTHANTIQDLLEEIGIIVGEHDELSHDINATVENGMEIAYTRAKVVKVTVDDVEKQYYTVHETVGDFLEAEGLEVSEHDDLSHQANDKIVENMTINLKKAFQVKVKDGKKKSKHVMTTGGTVKDVLAQANISFDPKSDDKINHKLNKTVTEEMTIKVTRVDIQTVEKEEVIDFKTVRKEDDTLEKGKEEVSEEGKKGILQKKIKITKENGKTVDKKIISEKVKEEPVDRVVKVGTKEPLKIVKTNGSKPKATLVTKTNTKTQAKPSQSDKKSGKVYYMDASAYTAQCNGCSGYTATGINLKANPHIKVVAVDPSIIPLGSTVWVQGYGKAIAGDTGGSIRGHRIDLHFPNKKAAYAFGRKKVKVIVLD